MIAWFKHQLPATIAIGVALYVCISMLFLTLAEYVSGPAAQLGNCPTCTAPYLSCRSTCTAPSSSPPASRATMGFSFQYRTGSNKGNTEMNPLPSHPAPPPSQTPSRKYDPPSGRGSFWSILPHGNGRPRQMAMDKFYKPSEKRNVWRWQQ